MSEKHYPGPNRSKNFMPVPCKPALIVAKRNGLHAPELRGLRAGPLTHRPLAVPTVPQPKTNHSIIRSKGIVENVSIRRVQPSAGVFQKKATNGTSHSHKAITGSAITRQTFKSAVVQTAKIYPNLHPGAIEPVNQGSIFRLNSFAGQYRLHRLHSHSVNVPNQQYNFVRTREGEMLLHNRYRHPSIAEGKHVLYAGEIFFNNGKLQWWSNGSGHYQPNVDDAEQANLPLDHFFSYQQIIKGEHMRKKR